MPKLIKGTYIQRPLISGPTIISSLSTVKKRTKKKPPKQNNPRQISKHKNCCINNWGGWPYANSKFLLHQHQYEASKYFLIVATSTVDYSKLISNSLIFCSSYNCPPPLHTTSCGLLSFSHLNPVLVTISQVGYLITTFLFNFSFLYSHLNSTFRIFFSYDK